jgi:AcrR family transcriptional regulator
MPKAIDDARATILSTAARLLRSEGYQHLAVRDIAAESGMATGTVYNYFHAKDEIVFELMRRDWEVAVQRMDSAVRLHEHETTAAGMKVVAPDPPRGGDTLPATLQEIFEALREFSSRYKGVWRLMAATPDSDRSTTVRAYDRTEYLGVLRGKIGSSLASGRRSEDDGGFLAGFIATIFAHYAMDDEFEYSRLDAVIRKLL